MTQPVAVREGKPATTTTNQKEPIMIIDLDDTSACPMASTCEVCGRGSRTLATGTVTTPLGVACVTLCTSCARAGRLGRWTPHTAAVRAGLHCEHLGIDLDEMAAALDRAR